MNDVDLEHDEELISRIRQTLDAVASATPLEGEAVPALRQRASRRPQVLFAAAAAVLAVVLAAAVLVAGRDAGTNVANPAPGGEVTPLPAGFDLATAAPVFSAEGDASAVAKDYISARMGGVSDSPGPGLTVTSVPEAAANATTAKARWRRSDDSGTVAEGDIHMRRDADRWVVVASTTDSIDTGSIAYDGVTISGTIRSTSEDSMFADVLDWMGEPVHNAPNPRGADGLNPEMGSAGGPAIGSLSIDIRHPGAPATVRIQLVGGAVLGVTEFRLDPPPLAPHQDYDACVRAHTTVEKEPTPDIVNRNCASALAGSTVAEGSAVDRTWQLVASDEPSGHFVTLRFRDQVGMFRMRTDGPAPERAAREDPVELMEVCCASGEVAVLVAVMHHDVGRVRLTTSAGTTVEAEAYPDVDRRYAVLVVEPTVEGEEASIEAQMPNGEWVPADGSFSLAVLGG